jgi:hypothetical protein
MPCGLIPYSIFQGLCALFLQRRCGRVFATEYALFTLMSAGGAAWVGGAVDSPLGISGTLWWMAALTVIPAILWAVWLRTGQFTEPVPEAAEVERS